MNTDNKKQEHKPIKKTKEFKKYESMNLSLKLKLNQSLNEL